MAADYVLVSSQTDAEMADLAKETVELRDAPDTELKELAGFYMTRGLDEALARCPVQAAVVSALSFAIGAIIPLVVANLAALGVWRWSEATHALVSRLDASSVAGRTQRYDADKIADLPAPVRRFFELVLTDGQRMSIPVRVSV